MIVQNDILLIVSLTTRVLIIFLLVTYPALVVKAEIKQEQNQPLKVFILSGQSNMEGYGSIEHMDLLVKDGYNDTTYRSTLWDPSTSTYKHRDDVYMKHFQSTGPLTVGYNTGYAGGNNRFGPEVMFGWTIGDYYNNKNDNNNSNLHNSNHHPNVLLIKVSYGGRSLGIDFRPPSSGEGKYINVKPTQYGTIYRNMINDAYNAIQNIPNYVPNFNATTDTYEINGFAWLQGWSDFSYQDDSMVHEYEYNLANFIRDVRLDLNLPNLPFVIGELGQHGLNVTGPASSKAYGIRIAQQNVCEQPEFQNNTKFVPTAQYAVSDGIQYENLWHYFGRADTYFHIGQALGQAMTEFLTSTSSSQATPAASAASDIKEHKQITADTTIFE